MWFLDSETLRSVALVSRFWNASANRRLWRNVVIDAYRAGCAMDADPAQIRTTLWLMCHAVTLLDRAASIRCVQLDVRQRLAKEDGSEDDALEELLDYITSTIDSCSGLKTLKIRARYHRREFARHLSARTFSFQLVELEASLTIHDGLGPFLLQQSCIEKWSVFWLRPRPGVDPQMASPLPDGTLPSIHTLFSCASQANHVLHHRHRQITRLELTDVDLQSLDNLGAGPFTAVQHLAFKAMADNDIIDANLAAAAEGLAHIFPNVTYLRICTHPEYCPDIEVLTALGQFQSLEHLSWVGDFSFPNGVTPPEPYTGTPDQYIADWSVDFLMLVSAEATQVRVAELRLKKLAHMIWTKVDERVNEYDHPPALINHGNQITKRRRRLWRWDVNAVIALEIERGNGHRELDARITDESEEFSDDDSSDESSMEE